MKKIINRIIILMAIFTKRVIAVLDMPHDIDDFVTFANGIHNSMAANAYFTGIAAKLPHCSPTSATWLQHTMQLKRCLPPELLQHATLS